MKYTVALVFMLFLLQSCEKKVEMSSINPVNWDSRKVELKALDSLLTGQTYLSVYSQIYSQSEHRTYNLTATVSIRNTNVSDSVFIENAQYFNTKGNLLRDYIDGDIFIAPMETVEIVIDETDQEGGTGANFLFDWKVRPGANDPFFEGVMISTSGQQGISFTTQGKQID